MIDFSGTQKRIVILFVALVLSRELVHAEDTPLYKTNRLAQITDAIFTALQEDTYHEKLLLHTAAPHDALIGAATYAQQLMMQEDTALKALGSPEEIRLLRTVLEDELASYKRASQCATPEKLLTRIPAIAGQDETVAGNFANWGTTTIETGLVINNNNGGTVAAPALQVASFTSNLAALVTTTAGQNILQVSTNTNQPALSIANAAGVYASAPGGTSLLVNGPGAFISSSGLTLTVTGNASNPAALLVGNSSTTAPALRLSNNPSSSMNDFALTIDASGNVKQSGSSLQSGFILNGGQPGPLTIGTTTTTGINFIINNITELSMLQNGNTIITGSLGIGTTSPITQLEVVQFNPVLTGSAATGTAPYGICVQGRYAYVPSRTSNLLQIFDVSNNPLSPTLVGSISTGLNQPYSVDVEGHYAYVVNFGGNTLQVFDISNPSAPALVGTSATTGLNQPLWITVQGRYAYVANSGGNTIQVFDVSNPTAPVSIATTATRSIQPRVIVPQGRYLYVAEFSGALEIFDLSNPAQLISVGYLMMGFEPAAISVQGRYAYVTNFGANSLNIIDVSNPTNPTLVGTATGLVEPVGVSVQGRYAYVLNSIGSGTLQIIDVSTPSAPFTVGSISTGSADPLYLFVQGRYAYFTSAGTGSGANTLQVIDLGGAYIQQLEAGSLEVGTLQTRENMTVNNDLDVVGGAIFGQGFQSTGSSSIVTATNASVAALNLIGNSTTTAPALRLTNNPPSASTDTLLTIDSSGNVKQSTAILGNGVIINGGQTGPLTIGTTNASATNFIANNATTMSIASNGQIGIGTTTPYEQLVISGTVPTTVTGSVTTGSRPASIFVQGRYAYVVNFSSNTLQVIDVSNSTPVVIATTATGTAPQSIYVQGRFAYVINQNSNTLQIFDISNPAVPTMVGTYFGLSIPTSVYVQGSYAFVTNEGSNSLQIFNVSNPTNPLQIGSVSTATGPLSVYVQGRYAYVAASSGASLQIFDVSNPASPVQVGSVTTGVVSPTSVYVQGRYAYVVTSTGNSLLIFDVSNPSSPTQVGSISTPASSSPYSVFVQGRYAYVTYSGTNFVVVFDVSTPSSPIVVGSIPTGASSAPRALYIQGRYLYVLAYTGGILDIYDIGGAYIQQLEAGGIEVGTLQTRSNMTVNNDFDVRGGAVFGQGFESTGASSIVVATNATVPALSLTGNSSITAPALQLNNNPAGAITDFVLTTDSSGAVKQSASQLQSQFILNGGQTGPLTIGTTSTTGINFIANNATVMTITASGQIGIGTTAPFTQFEVVQNTPKLISTTLATAGGTTRALCVQGRYAYVINQNAANMQVFDVSNPASPLLIATLTTGTTPDGICVQGKYLYIVNYTSSTLQVIDISNPYAPTIMNGTGTATGTNPTYVAVQGRYVYVTSLTSNALQIFDVGNPIAPVLVGSLAIGGATPQTYAVFVQGRYAYVLNYNTNTLEIVDVSDPANPTQVSLTTTNANPNGIYVQGRYVYIVNRTANSLQIVDAYNPAAPVVVSTTTTTGQPFFLTVQGRYAYLTNTSGNTLQIFDVSNPGVPILVGTVGTGNSPEGIAIEGRYIYLVNAADSSLQIFDSGGAYIQQFEAGGMEVGTLQTRGNLTVNNDFDTRGGASFGQGFQSTGASSITTNSSAAGFQNVSGLTISVGAQNAITTSAGTVSLPAYSFTGNTAAGLYAPATNQLALVTSNTARLIVDSTGSVSCFSNYKVHAFPSQTQTCASGSTTVINFGTITFDPQNSFATTNGYVAPISGYYFVAVQVSYIIGAANLAFTRTLGLTRNGTALAGYGAVALTTVNPITSIGTVTGPYNLDTACIVQLNQGDILRATWTQSSGASDTIQTSGTHIDIHFISTV